MAKKDLIKLEDVYFAYVKADKPYKNMFDTSGLSKEFSATVFLSKEQRKQFKERKLNKTVKEIDTAAFKEKYQFEPPYPDQDEQYFIQVSKKATYKDGNLKPDFTFTRVFFQKEETIIESRETKIGNGSFGDIRLELNFNEALNQTNVVFDSILVKKHVEYISKGDEWASVAIPGANEVKGVDKTPPTPSSVSTPVEEDLDDDLPF